MSTFNIGLGGKTYYGTAGSAPATELTNVQDASFTPEINTVESASRASGWKGAMPGLGSGSAEIKLLADGANSGQAALQTAFLAKTKKAFKFIDTAGYGFWADFIITSFPLDQPLEDAQVITIGLKMDGAPTAVTPP